MLPLAGNSMVNYIVLGWLTEIASWDSLTICSLAYILLHLFLLEDGIMNHERHMDLVCFGFM